MIIPAGIVAGKPAGGGGGYTGPLDIVSGAVVAYWQYRMAAAFSGPVIKINNGTTTQDFTANTNNGVDAAAISAFVGAGTPTVATLYDQSGNSKDATQGTAANQPGWSASGIGGKPTLAFDSSLQQMLETASVEMFSDGGMTVFAVVIADYDGANGTVAITGQNNEVQSGDGSNFAVSIRTLNIPDQQVMVIRGDGIDFNEGVGAESTASITLDGVPAILVFSTEVDATTLLYNGVEASIGSSTSYGSPPMVMSAWPLVIGNSDAASPTAFGYFNGKLAALLIYPSKLSAQNIADISALLAAPYGIALV